MGLRGVGAPSLLERLDSKVERLADGCWLWIAYRDGDGYGRTSVGGRQLLAHRAVYEALVGRIPEGMQLDHLCRNRGCVNPAHMEPVTSDENTQRGETGAYNRLKTHCPKGHPYDDENTVRGGPDGMWRACRICRNEQGRQSRRRRKGRT